MNGYLLAVVIASVPLLAPSRASATAEICGNDIDDDGNGLTDEGCYPTLTTGVCESPLSCGDTGMVSWITGALHYDLPPDIAPAVPYGPGIGFRRFATPSYSPGGAGPTSVNHTPLGPGWQHTYMTWIDAYTDGGGTKRVVLHTSQGRDVYYTWASNGSGFDNYTPQAGDHVMSLKYDTTNLVYYVQLLTGETLKYNQYGQIIEIWDTISPTPNKVLITWDNTVAGNVSTVTDASGQRRLSFTYANNLLTSLTFQLLISSVWTTELTTNYNYGLGVTRDATSGWYTPASAADWSTLLTGTGISSPTNMWGCQDSSGNLAAAIGSVALTAHGAGTYSKTVSGWTRKAVATADGGTVNWQSASSICNPKTTSCTSLGLVHIFTNPGGTRDIMTDGDGAGARAYVTYESGPHLIDAWEGWAGNHTASAIQLTTTFGGHTFPYILSTNPGGSTTSITVGPTTQSPTWAAGTSANGNFTLGSVTNTSAGADYLYAAEWNGTALTSAQAATVVQRIENGPGILTSVAWNGKTAQQYKYAQSGYLSQVLDGETTPNQIAAFSYSSTVAGQVDLISTTRGTVGFEYSSTRTGCTGDTILYFNHQGATSCSIDSDCGSGFLCGGKTTSGSTGACFLAARCMATSTVNGEAVITNVTPIGPGGTCTGACTDVSQYSWSATSNLLNVTGRKDPVNNYTSATYNSNGLPTQIGYGDTDADPTNGGTNRTVYYFYDTTFPGRISEIRRPSDLSSSAGSCSATNTAGCDRTLYAYGTDNQLHTVEQDGWTLASNGTTTTFASVITYSHDSVGRLSEIDGAITGIKSAFDYYTSTESNALLNNFLKDEKTYIDATNFLEPQITSYDFWGHPISLKAPDGAFTCDVYDSDRGFQTQRRKAMAGQTDCVTSNSLDIITSWARDSWLRLTKLTRPDSSCLVYGYDTIGRLSGVTRSDTCSSSSGDSQLYLYLVAGQATEQVSEIDTFDSKGTKTAAQPYTYFNSRRLQEIVNPVDTSKFKGLVYDAAGKLTEVDGENSLSKTVYHFDGAPGRDGRISSEEHYKTSSTSDTWSLLYAWLGDQSQVTDGDSKVTGSVRDDLGRLVKITSPDLANPTVRVFDAASRLTTVVEDLGGGGNQQTHSFTYDFLNRPLNADYQGSCATAGTAHPEIQRAYDTLPSGVTCPMSGGCNNLAGRLAYVEVILMCSSTYNSYPFTGWSPDLPRA